MIKNKAFSIGVMSGTSLDGIDLVYVSFDVNNYANFDIIHAQTIPYNKEWKQLLQNAIFSSKDDLKTLDKTYGKFLGNTIQDFIKNHKIDTIDFIASHGHTVLHQPEKGVTLQIGNGKEIAKITSTKVVCNFRTQDVKLGGQGAPLVPIGDALLFSDYKYCVNLGGFSNISFKKGDDRIAFDISPVNIVLNHYVKSFNVDFDDKGKIASTGRLNQSLFNRLNQLDFYDKKPPKSLGLEWVQENIFPVIDAFNLNKKDILRTFVEHIAYQISKNIKKEASVLFTGGGVFNTFLMERITFFTSITYDLPDCNVINFKEALIFSLLGMLKINNEINCLKSVTGASKNHSSGVVFMP